MGLAVADPASGVVSPLTVVAYGGIAAAARVIAGVAAELGAQGVVIGRPTLEDGSDAPAVRRSQLLAEAVRELGFEAFLQPEFLSTVEARRRARSAGRRAGRAIDDIAAQVILEDFLEGRAGGAGQ